MQLKNLKYKMQLKIAVLWTMIVLYDWTFEYVLMFSYILAYRE